MDRNDFAERITQSVDGLPGQLGAAARYVLDNPGDVALLSMREQARRAGVRPWTMTRLAKRLGLDGYDDVRQLHGEALKEQALGFSGRASAQLARQKQEGGGALGAEMAGTMAAQIAAMAAPARIEVLAGAARDMAAARRIYCFGLRSGRPVASHLAYVLSFLGDKTVLLDGDGGAGLDALRFAGAGDIFFVATVSPYTRASVEAARFAAGKGLVVVAITDSAASPVASVARHVIVAATESPSFFHAMAPAFAAAEILAALVAGEGGESSLEAIARAEEHLAERKVHLHDRPQPPEPR